jgi:hypothetical protein
MWFGEPHPFPDHLPDWAHRDNKVAKGDRVDHFTLRRINLCWLELQHFFKYVMFFPPKNKKIMSLVLTHPFLYLFILCFGKFKITV